MKNKNSRKNIKNVGIPFALSASIHLSVILMFAISPANISQLSYSQNITQDMLHFRLGQINITEHLVKNKLVSKESMQEKTASAETFSFPMQKDITHLHPRKNTYQKKQDRKIPIQGEAGNAYKTLTSRSKANEYVASIRRRLQENIFYPFQAKMLGLEGKVIIAFHIDSHGHIKNMEMLSSSPHNVLNDAASRIVNNASPFPSPPENFTESIQVPLVFKIKN